MSMLLSLLLLAGQAQPSAAATRADKFALDLPADDAAPADQPAADQPAADQPPADLPATARPREQPMPAAPAPLAPAATDAARTSAAATAHVSLDTPIADLIADPAAKAVLDRDMPGLSTDENLSQFQALSLRRLAPLSGGQMTAELMNTLAYDLAALGGGAPPPGPQPARRKLPSGR